MTDVSVVVPTRNRADLLPLTVRSALGQRNVDLELVVVDDGSDDDTVRLVTHVDDPRVRLVRHERPCGVSAARNSGIAAARGRWVALLDDDDVWAPDKLATQLVAAGQVGRSWVYTGDVGVDGDLQVVSGAPPLAPEQVMAALPHHNAVPAGASNVMATADLFARVGAFDPDLHNNEDWDMWLRLAADGPPACVPRPLVAYRLHPGNASRNMARMLAELEVIARRHMVPVDRAAHRRWAAWSELADGRRWRAVSHYMAAVRRGDVASLPRAAVATMLGRRVVDVRTRNSAGLPWAAEAQRWLDDLRATS
jgi:glycosyltransferase involved in cell wall biosynthesis